MIPIKSWLACPILICLCALPAVSQPPPIINPPEVQDKPIPASACRPESNAADARVSLSNGAYVFNANVTGTVTLYCPWIINENDMVMRSYRVYYRDSDGSASASRITVRFAYRDQSSQKTVGLIWNSNTVNATGNTTQVIPLFHTLASNRLYYFVVTIRRTTASQNPVFSGIDFP